MIPIYKSLRRFYLYLGVLLFSIASFYAFDGKFETDLISFPTLWTDWFYFLYIVIPLFILVRLLYRGLIKKIPYTQSLHSLVFIVSLSIVELVYWVAVDIHKKLLFNDVQGITETITNEMNSIKISNINSRFEFNKFNKKRSYKISFTTSTKPTYETHMTVKGYVVGTNKHVFSRSLILEPDKLNQSHYFYISEEYQRDKVTSNDEIYFKISHYSDFPRKIYKAKAEFAQKLCT